MQVCDRRSLPLVQALIAAGADINLRDRSDATALMWASHRGYGEIVKVLLEIPNIELDWVNKGGYTALKLAEFNQYPEVVTLLKSVGAKD